MDGGRLGPSIAERADGGDGDQDNRDSDERNDQAPTARATASFFDDRVELLPSGDLPADVCRLPDGAIVTSTMLEVKIDRAEDEQSSTSRLPAEIRRRDRLR